MLFFCIVFIYNRLAYLKHRARMSGNAWQRIPLFPGFLLSFNKPCKIIKFLKNYKVSTKENHWVTKMLPVSTEKTDLSHKAMFSVGKSWRHMISGCQLLCAGVKERGALRELSIFIPMSDCHPLPYPLFLRLGLLQILCAFSLACAHWAMWGSNKCRDGRGVDVWGLRSGG